MTPASPSLDTRRFPGRTHLASVLRHHQANVLGPAADLALELRESWARHLGLAASDLILTGSAAEAFRLPLHALLAPEDLVIIAEPAPTEAVVAILAAGARYIDVGRLHDGSLDPQAVALALRAAPQAVVLGEQASLFGTDDGPMLAATPARAWLNDARHAAGWAGAADRPCAATAHAIALREPAEPGHPLWHAVVCAPGTGPDLQRLQGPVAWPVPLLRQGLAVLTELRNSPHLTAAADIRLHQHHQSFCAAVTGLPGVRLLPRSGFRVAAECLAGDAVARGAALARQLAPLDAYPSSTLRHLLVADLGRIRTAPGAEAV